MFRVEDKFLISASEALVLQNKLIAVGMAPDRNSIEGCYNITSVYFDDMEDRDYHDTLSGIPKRSKCRIRWYNGSFDLIRLEYKDKLYNRISKSSDKIKFEEFANIMNGDNIEDRESKVFSRFYVDRVTRNIKPKVIITYDRNAFVLKTGNVRITFDTNLRAVKATNDFIDQIDKYETFWELDGYYILEVKYDEFLPDYVAQVLDCGNMNVVSFSKYRICRDMVDIF